MQNEIFLSQYKSLFTFEQNREKITIQVILTITGLIVGWFYLLKDYSSISVSVNKIIDFILIYKILQYLGVCPQKTLLFLYFILNIFILWIFNAYLFMQTYHYRINFYFIKEGRKKYYVEFFKKWDKTKYENLYDFVPSFYKFWLCILSGIDKGLLLLVWLLVGWKSVIFLIVIYLIIVISLILCGWATLYLNCQIRNQQKTIRNIFCHYVFILFTFPASCLTGLYFFKKYQKK